MLFNSLEFIFIFCPIVVGIFYALSHFRLYDLAIAFLCLASLFFYSYWRPEYLILLLCSIAFNYLIGRAIQASQPGGDRARWLMIFGIVLNLAALAYYKYAGFAVKTANGILSVDAPVPEIVLPLAISFYSFTQIAYLVDAYRGDAGDYNPVVYTLFISFFPQLIAGPILRHDQLIPELENKQIFTFSQRSFATGIAIFLLGLAKKILIADTISPWVGGIFSNAGELNFVEAWFGALAYTFQLYFDFSGYSDMAVGLGRMFNVHIPLNFNSPYKATSIADFWRRWHITLSNFLRDYLYIPLGGNRKGKIRQYINLVVTMLLGGLWHGAGWTFVLWGGLHGIYLALHRIWSQLSISIPAEVSRLLTFACVVISWVLFRSQSLPEAMSMLSTMAGAKGIVIPAKLSILESLDFLNILTVESGNISEVFARLPGGSNAWTLLNCSLLVCVGLAARFSPNTQEIVEKFEMNWYWGACLGVLASIAFLSLSRPSEFLYFQF